MTGYGSAKGMSGKTAVSIELRSVNNRFLDCSVRSPRGFATVEDAVKEHVQKYISRGKVDVFITIDSSQSDNVSINVNRPLADAYYAAIRELSETYSIPNDNSAVSLARIPDVLRVEKTELDIEALTADICTILDEALEGFDVMRSAEGRRLYDDISARLDEIERLTSLAEERSPQTVAEYRSRLLAKMTEVLQSTNIDENRILLEAALFADKVAINEEIVRLRSHVSQLRGMLDSGVPVGRKIDFLIQELNREANTIGSKGNDTEMAHIVVDLKAEIEKVREQVQNIE